MTPDPRDVEQCRRWAQIYRSLGFNPLPSRMDAKRPMVKFAEYWERPFPREEFERWETTNVQVMTGRHWGLLVIDLDGLPAREWWQRSFGGLPRTWITHSSGDGLHVWFAVPRDYSRALPKGFLWKSEGKHEAVERLCDRSLIMAPPSWHPSKEGVQYRFLPSHHPGQIARPIACPRAILDLPTIEAPTVRLVEKWDGAVPFRAQINSATGRHYDLQLVLDSIPDKIALASEWGVRIAGKATERGWVPCHSVDREDVHPSAAIHRESGGYVDQGSGLRLPLFKLSVHLGIFPDVGTAITQLGDRYVARKR